MITCDADSVAAGRVSVIVPSYNRPDRLVECLRGLADSVRVPDEILVVLRPDDERSHSVVTAQAAPAVVVPVHSPGMLAAMAAGLRQATGSVVVFMDDDAVPRPDWLTRILGHLAAPAVGGAGGRDIVTDPDSTLRTPVAGRINRWGRVTGNHHLVKGSARDVDVLKGANMAFKREALALPVSLLGQGAEVHNEIAICLFAQKRGWRLVLDPQAEVLHLPGERFDEDRRGNPSLWATHWAACNLTRALLTLRPGLTLRRLLYGILIGDRAIPGAGRALLALFQGETEIVRRFGPSVTGQVRGAAMVACGRGVRMHLVVDRLEAPEPASR